MNLNTTLTEIEPQGEIQYNLKTITEELNKELLSTAQSVCRIGFLLKVARDYYLNSHYSDIYDYAQKEFGLDKSQTSRFMRINDRFSVGGNTEQLLPEYSEFGSSKLSIMLTLPDEINEELSPEMSKSDIQAIKDEYDEEQKTTPLEHMAEDTSAVPDDFCMAVAKQLNDEHPESAEFIHEYGTDPAPEVEDIKEYYMPDGDKTYIINMPGTGKLMVKCTDERLLITSLADGTKTPVTWTEFAKATIEDVAHRDFTVKKTEKKDKPKEKPKKVEKSKPAKQAPPKKGVPTKAAGEPEKNTEQQAKIEETKKDTEEERKLKRIANDLHALADQFDRGTGGNLYDNPIEELEGMIDEINSLPGELIPIIRDAIKRIPEKEDES